MRRKITIFLIVFISALIIAGCSKGTEDTTGTNNGEDSNLNKTGFPIVNESITLDIFARKDPATHDDWNDAWVLNQYEEMTNVDINWEMVPHDSFSEKFYLKLGSDSLPDVFYGGYISDLDLMKYGDQGIFISLNDLIEEYAPNLQKVLDEYPEVREALTMIDGNIYSFPFANHPDFISKRIAPYPFINQDWLDALGMEMPQTTDDFYEYLKGVKEGDPSNGKVDEIPFGSFEIGHLYNYLKGSFGVANKGPYGYVDIDPDTDDYRFYPTSDQYKELLIYINKLYEEELIEQNIFAVNREQHQANKEEGRYGSFVWYAVPEDDYNWKGMPALTGPNGDRAFTDIKNPVASAGAFVITSENEYPEATVRWVDHFYSDEGMELFFMGIEGETYEVDDDGNLVYLEEVDENVTDYFIYDGGGYAALTKEEFFTGAESTPEALQATEALEPDVLQDPWTPVKHTQEEVDKLQGFGSDIEKYVSEMRDKFIAGNEPFSKWDEYVEAIQEMGLNDYMDIKIKAIERQTDN